MQPIRIPENTRNVILMMNFIKLVYTLYPLAGAWVLPLALHINEETLVSGRSHIIVDETKNRNDLF